MLAANRALLRIKPMFVRRVRPPESAATLDKMKGVTAPPLTFSCAAAATAASIQTATSDAGIASSGGGGWTISNPPAPGILR